MLNANAKIKSPGKTTYQQQSLQKQKRSMALNKCSLWKQMNQVLLRLLEKVKSVYEPSDS